jgi:hypothetical protein
MDEDWASPRVQGLPAAFEVKDFGPPRNMENIVFSNITERRLSWEYQGDTMETGSLNFCN